MDWLEEELLQLDVIIFIQKPIIALPSMRRLLR